MSFLAAALSGLLLTLSFPVVINGVRLPDLSVLAWVALVPLVMVCRRQSLRKVVVLTFFTGLIYNALVSYWIFYAMYIYGGLSVVASLAGVVSMATILAAMLSTVLLLVFCLDRWGRLPLIVGLPVFWALYEWIRNYGPFGGYPWSQLAYSQTSFLSVIQSADLFGVYGLCFLIVFVNLGAAELAEWGIRRRRFPWCACLSVALLFGVNYFYGVWRLANVEAALQQSESLKVGLVQPNVPQELKWRPEQADESVQILTRLTEQAIAQGAEFVMWPEAAYPDTLPSNLARLQEFSQWNVPVLVGAVTVLPPKRLSHYKRPLLQNSAVQIDAAGHVGGMYHKVHLVPLGEYIPLKNILGFLDKVVPAIGDFLRGDQYQLLQVDHRRYGVTLCYEDLFPEISRAFVLSGADFLTNITNDAWYGDSSAPWQHLAFSRFRAIENRRSMLRSTNTGVTAAIDPTGRIQAQLPIFEEGALVSSIPVGGSQTLYTRYQDIPWLILLGLVLAISAVIFNSKRQIR